MTVGTLRTMLQDLPDEMVVVAPSDNFELGGAILQATERVMVMTSGLECFQDAFDSTDYSQMVWTFNITPQSQPVLVIVGRDD
jgi:hypothetical protein